MKWFWNRCRRRREAFASWPPARWGKKKGPSWNATWPRAPECRSYYGEIKALAAPLAGWEKNFPPSNRLRPRGGAGPAPCKIRRWSRCSAGSLGIVLAPSGAN